jgi:hypothetical protein
MLMAFFMPLLQGHAQQPCARSGAVTASHSGEPLPGVNVLLKGTLIGSVTDAEGKYSLTIPDTDGVLVFSFIGYSTTEIPVSGWFSR